MRRILLRWKHEIAGRGADEAAIVEKLRAAVQGGCRVRVDEVGFGEVEDDASVIEDVRNWE